MVSKKGVVLKKRVSRLCKVCVLAERSMDAQAGEKYKHPGQETSYERAQCAVSLCYLVLVCISYQYKDYENKYKETKSKKGKVE